MASPSKEDNILKLFFENSPTKHWHFEEILKESGVTRGALNKWLLRYCKEGLLKRVKEKGKFSYFTVGEGNLIYQTRKKIYGIDKLYKSGLVEYLMMRGSVKTAIIFGSYAKGDWYKESDIDIFIYGNISQKEMHDFEDKLSRFIELHIFENKDQIKNVKSGLIQNVTNGHIIKGRIQDFAEVCL